MLQTIKFIEKDADGCGTDIVELVAVKTDLMLTRGHVHRLDEAIKEAKKELFPEESMEELINYAMEKIFPDEKYEFIVPDIEVNL